MKIAIVGSRGIDAPDIEAYLPRNVTEIVSGGAVGVDSTAREYALSHNIKLVEILPDYKKYGRRAPLVRNRAIADYSDSAIAFWDGRSKGTENVIACFHRLGKPVLVVNL